MKATASIFPFVLRPPRGAKTYRAEFVLFEGYKRRQWAVIERSPDGSEEAISVYRGRMSEAIGMARMFAKGQAKNQEMHDCLTNNPLWQMIMAMSEETRELLARMLRYEHR